MMPLSPVKPIHSAEYSRDEIRTPTNLLKKEKDSLDNDFSSHIQMKRDTLHTSHNTGRPNFQLQSPFKLEQLNQASIHQKYNGSVLERGVQTKSQDKSMQEDIARAVDSETWQFRVDAPDQCTFLTRLAHRGFQRRLVTSIEQQNFSSPVRASVSSSAKQHQFRKQLNLPAEREKHHLVIIESPIAADHGKSSSIRQSREITLKAVKMSQSQQENNEQGKPSPKRSQDQSIKLKTITTQLPQSLLINNNHSQQRALELLDDAFNLQLATLTSRKQQMVSSQKHQPATNNQKGGINQSENNIFLLPTQKNLHGRQTSMPPSLTAINVNQSQIMAHELKLSQFSNLSTPFNPTVSKPVTQRRGKKKQGNGESSGLQLKLSRRQIQFYQKRHVEKNLPARTPKSAFVTRRLLFNRRARLQDQNLIIFYFDGVIGELCTKNTSYGYFKVRHGAFQSLRKLFYKHQIAIFIPYVKSRAKVISCYIDRFQGCPVDAIYCVRSEFLQDHNQLKFIDYSQIYEDFDILLDEKLIEKCIVVAPRTKEVSSIHSQNPSETVSQANLWTTEKNQPEENLEEQKLMQMYLMNQELDTSSKVEIFQFQGCPIKLSSQLEPVKRKVNYLLTVEESLSPSAPRKDIEPCISKEKLTATQANKIAVDLGQLQKPVTLFVPHSKNSITPMYSFYPILKTLEALAILDEHCKSRRETPKNKKDILEQLETIRNLNSSAQKNFVSNSVTGQHSNPSHFSPKSKSSSKNITSGQKQDLEPFSAVDSFYAFKAMLVDSKHMIHESLLNSLFAVETKKVQTFLYRDQMLARVLLEKSEIKKCYQYTQQKDRVVDRTVPTQSSHYILMKSQNEWAKRYIQDYQQAYYYKVKEQMDEAKVMRMTAYFMNQFSQKMVEDHNKKPNQHLREMFHKEINYNRDLPSRNINLFKNHRFLILVKNTGLGNEIYQEDQSKTQSMETIDIQKIMGNNYFRQLETYRQGGPTSKHTPPDILPPDIVRILYKQRHSDSTDWFVKKAFAKPIQLLENQQAMHQRKELINRGEQEKQLMLGYQPPGTAKTQDSSSLPPFYRSHTIEAQKDLRLQSPWQELQFNFETSKRTKGSSINNQRP